MGIIILDYKIMVSVLMYYLEGTTYDMFVQIYTFTHLNEKYKT